MIEVSECSRNVSMAFNSGHREGSQLVALTTSYTVTDGDEVIPYTVGGSTEKVSLRVYSRLKFHGTPYAMKSIDTVHTNYTNYLFKDEQGQFCPRNYSRNNVCIS